LFISSEIEEIVRNSSRVVVLRERNKVGEFTSGDIQTPTLMRAMAGGGASNE
jgi:simple sugar transport system ATP-binding protein